MASRPPLNAIHVFCEAARCSSFKLAAQALCVTPGAVSRQVKTLEDYLGLALFERGPHAIHITRKGQMLFDRVATKMASVQTEVDLLRDGRRKAVIRVDTGVTLAMHWLIPRLSQFSDAHPNLLVQLVTSNGAIELARPADVFIRRDPAELGGLPSQTFLEEFSLLVGAPAFLKGKPSTTLRNIERAPRIAARSRPDLWPQWCAHHGLPEANYRPTLEFDNTVLAIQALTQALGVMVVPVLFIESLLERRMLMALNPTRVRTGSYAYAMRARRDSQRAALFTTWLQQVPGAV